MLREKKKVTAVLLIALAFENCVDLAHAPLAFLYSDFVWGLCGSKVTRKTQPLKRKCNQQYLRLKIALTLRMPRLRFYTAILYGVYVGQRSHATRRLFKRKCNQQ